MVTRGRGPPHATISTATGTDKMMYIETLERQRNIGVRLLKIMVRVAEGERVQPGDTRIADAMAGGRVHPAVLRDSAPSSGRGTGGYMAARYHRQEPRRPTKCLGQRRWSGPTPHGVVATRTAAEGMERRR